MSEDLLRGWAPVYPHVRYEEPGEATDWLVRVFGFHERARMARPTEVWSPPNSRARAVGS